jgi:hypothetical protein
MERHDFRNACRRMRGAELTEKELRSGETELVCHTDDSGAHFTPDGRVTIHGPDLTVSGDADDAEYRNQNIVLRDAEGTKASTGQHSPPHHYEGSATFDPIQGAEPLVGMTTPPGR